jgi:hypothetical protein
MKTLAALAVLGIVFVPLPTLANDDAEACKPDVFRLCSAAIPWKDRIVACLHENKRKLSPACHQVFNRKPTKDAKRFRSEPRPRAAQYEPGSWR